MFEDFKETHEGILYINVNVTKLGTTAARKFLLKREREWGEKEREKDSEKESEIAKV
jgi:hypothetical protein